VNCFLTDCDVYEVI